MANNFIYIGLISEVKDDKARVAIADYTTDFLHIIGFASSFKKIFTPIKVNEQVVILAVNGDVNSGVILRGVYGGENTAPETSESKDIITYSDGTKIIYDTTNSIMQIEAKGEIKIKCNSATVEAEEVVIKSSNIDLGGKALDKLVTDKHQCFFTGGLHNIKTTQNVKAK